MADTRADYSDGRRDGPVASPDRPFDFDMLFRRAMSTAELDEMEMAEAELEEAAAAHTGAMVALYPTRAVARKLAQKGGEPVDELHVTLAFLGKAADLDDHEKLKDLVRGWAAATPPLEGEVSGVGLFTAGPEPVTYASVDLPGLPEARQQLVDLLDGAGYPPSRQHGFTPHMTLAYEKRDVTLPKTKLTFAGATLSLADERFDFDFSGSP